MNPTSQQRNYYDKYWIQGRAGYSGESQGYAENFRRWMGSELASLPQETRILEVGCGDASFTRNLSQFSSSVTAIDISERQIEQNRRDYPEIRFIQHDVVEPLPFEKGEFEVIWCSEVLEHLFDPVFALREMHRVMAPGGRLLVTVPYHGQFKNLLIALFKWDEHFAPHHPHIRFFTRNTLTRATATAGFIGIETRTCGMNRPLRDLFVATNILMKAEKP